MRRIELVHRVVRIFREDMKSPVSSVVYRGPYAFGRCGVALERL
jgi:hypothetical protein